MAEAHSVMVRVSRVAHGRLKKLADAAGVTITEMVDRAVESLEKATFWDSFNASVAALQRDPKAWKAYMDEARAWDCALSDGLEPEDFTGFFAAEGEDAGTPKGREVPKGRTKGGRKDG